MSNQMSSNLMINLAFENPANSRMLWKIILPAKKIFQNQIKLAFCTLQEKR